MTQLLLVRHAQSVWNAERRWQGWADPPLSDLGRRQAASAALVIGSIDAVVSSDLQRATDTAQVIAEAARVGQVVVEPGFRERGVGEFTGLTHDEIEQRWPGVLRTFVTTTPPGGEDLADVNRRVVAALERVAARYGQAEVLVVTHGGVIRNLVRHLGAEPEPVPNLGGLRVEVEAGQLHLGAPVLLLDPADVTVTVPRQL